MSNDKHPLHNGKFKNLGIDRNLIQKEAHTYNQKVEKHYHGGRREDDTIVNKNVARQPPIPAAKSEDWEEDTRIGEQQTMEINYPQLKREMGAMMDEKVLELAMKMQQYADETDARLEKIESLIHQLREQKGADRPVQDKLVEKTEQQAPPQQQTQAPTGKGNGNNLDPKLSIENVFDFSGSRDGKIKRQ